MGASGFTMARRSLSDAARAPSTKIALDGQVPDLLQQLLLALAAAVVARRIARNLEVARCLREKQGFPLVALARVHAVAARQLRYRLLLLHRFKRRLGLECGVVLVAARFRHRCCSLLQSHTL
jgi:hypothetical protein